MPATRFDEVVGLRLLNLHQFIYERTGGLIGHRLGPVKTLLLRTRGRRSGEMRTAALTYLDDSGRYVVVGSRGGSDAPPSWLLNLQANPEVEVQVGTHRSRALARIANDAERKRLWPKMVALWPDYARYQAQTERVIPLVILKPQPSA